ncbi:MAG: methyltransferase domain-containing protein [Bacteroidota bacterium]
MSMMMKTEIATVDIACPNCGYTERELWARDNGYSAQQCAACGFIYVSPRPPADAIDEAAQTGLHATDSGAVDRVGLLNFRRSKQRMFEQRLSELYPGGELAARPRTWLDVGCGFGELVAAVQALVPEGSSVKGVDPCLPKVRVAQRRGLPVTSETLSEVHGAFDVISLVNVFSHLPDPFSFVSDLKTKLKDRGEIILVTGNAAELPNREAYPDPLYLPDHLVFAGEAHLRALFERDGFEVVQVLRMPYFFRDPLLIPKNIAKVVLGRPTEQLRNTGPFRSLFVRARLS